MSLIFLLFAIVFRSWPMPDLTIGKKQQNKKNTFIMIDVGDTLLQKAVSNRVVIIVDKLGSVCSGGSIYFRAACRCLLFM